MKDALQQAVALRKQGVTPHLEAWLAAREIIEAIPLPVALSDGGQQIVCVNQAFLDMFGYAAESVPDLNRLIELVCPDADSRRNILGMWNVHHTTPHPLQSVESRIVDKDGHLRTMLISTKAMEKQPEANRIVIFEDVTERRTAEAKVDRLGNLYKALGQINQAIVRMESGETLFPLVCRIAVELGGMTLASVRQVNPVTRRADSVASFGSGAEFLKALNISTDGSVPEGCGPVGLAFRENRIIIVDDYVNDPRTRPWHEQGRKFGWGSSGTFPIQRGGKSFASLGVYHKSTHAFDTETVDLLKGMAQDITFALDSFDREQERQRARSDLIASERHFRAYFDYAMVGMTASSITTGALLEVNDTLCKLLGYTTEELMKISWTDITHPADVDESTRAVASIARGEATNFELEKRYIRKDGTVMYAHVASRGVQDESGRTDYLVTIIDDITEAKIHQDELERLVHALSNSEEQLRQLNRSLEMQVSDRTRHLAEANQTLKTTLRELEMTQNELIMSEKLASLGSLVAGISHELNTPIGNVLMVVSALESLFDQLLKQVELGQVKKIEASTMLRNGLDMAKVATRSITRAADLIQSFKQVAVDQTSEHRREFDLRVVVDDVVSTFAVGAKLKLTRIEIVNEVPVGILCNSYPGPLGQVIVNLVQNAVIHAFDTNSPGRVVLRGAEQNGLIELSVADNGKGMPPEVASHVYDPFFTTRLGQGGSGLGLAISYNIMTSVMGGRISVATAPGKGSTFTLCFPKLAPDRDKPAT